MAPTDLPERPHNQNSAPSSSDRDPHHDDDQHLHVPGMIVGSSVMVGSWLSKRIVLRMDAAHFKLVMDGMMLVAALTMLVSALH